MYKWFLIFLLSFYFPAVSQESNEPFMEQLTRAQIWCEVISQDVYELSMIRHRGISQSDFLEAGKETFQGLGHRLRQRMNQEKEGIKVLRKLEAQIELEIKKTDKFWPVYEKIIEGLFSVARVSSTRKIQEQSKVAKDEFFNGCFLSFTSSSSS
tara:strand:- start:310 stop:771 length:462 start_codon:yes stop_codon:yes gene_type:complete